MGLFDFLRRRSDPPADLSAAKRRALSKRLASRNLLQAANVSRLEQTWISTPHSADAYIQQNWLTIVARARDAAENQEHGRKFVQLVKDNIAGPNGFRFHADVRDPSQTVDMVASNAIEAEFRRFSKKGNFDVTGMLSRTDFERLWCSQLAVDGEAIAVKVYGTQAGPYGFALQMIDPVFLDPQHNEILQPGGNFIRHGIEFTREGRPVRYHFREIDEVLPNYTSYAGMRYRVVPADMVIHDFLPERVGQKRGLSWMRAALWRMRMLKGYEDAAVTNARVGAAKMGFFRDPDGEILNEDELPMDAEPGTFQNIGGLEFQSFDPQYPAGDFGPFMKRCLMSMASGLGPSYHNLASDMEGVNYTSSRTAELAEREIWKGAQKHVIDSMCTKVYEAWIDYCLLTDKILINGKPLRVARAEAYKEAGKFTGRRWAWVDPQKEISANAQAVELGVKSRQSIMRENGEEPWTVWDEIEEERAEMERRGIPADNPKHIAAQAAADKAAEQPSNSSE